jgi:hypothetical protein
MKYLTVAACIKNEGPHLKEWLDFHRIVGVEHFYLYNNNSTDNSREVLKPYIDTGVVTLNDCSMDACQLACYFHALYYNRSEARWMAFIDADEFLFCPTGQSLPEFLSGFEQFPGVVAQWACFGSNGHDRRPAGFVIENYTRRAPLAAEAFEPNKHVKSIVNPALAHCPSTNPHQFVTRGNVPVVNEKREPNGSPFMVGKSSSERIRINHYFCRSREDFEQKIARGRADCADPEARASHAGKAAATAALRSWEQFDE